MKERRKVSRTKIDPPGEGGVAAEDPVIDQSDDEALVEELSAVIDATDKQFAEHVVSSDDEEGATTKLYTTMLLKHLGRFHYTVRKDWE